MNVPVDPPTLLSLMPFVNGLFVPIDILPEQGADVPVRRPMEITILLCGPRGWQPAGTSSEIIPDVRALPPSFSYFSGTGSWVIEPSDTLTL